MSPDAVNEQMRIPQQAGEGACANMVWRGASTEARWAECAEQISAPTAIPYRPLGIYRFCLAFAVVSQHFQCLLPQADRGIFSRMGFGAIAVCAFFMVSGFVVAEASATFYFGRPAAFLANRALRLVPPYMAALGLAVAVHECLWQTNRLILWDFKLNGAPHAPARLLTGVLGLLPGFNSRWFGQDFEFIPFVWTLRMEIAFYLAAALLMVIVRRVAACWVVDVTIVAGLGLSAAFLAFAGRPGALSTAPMFLVGVCLFPRPETPRQRRAAMLAVSVALAAVGFASWRQHGTPVLAWQLLLLAGVLAIFVRLVTVPQTAQMLWDRRVGNLSFPLYLNHYVVGIVATSLTPAPGICLYGAALLAAIGLAVLAEHVVDRPLRRRRDKIRTVAI